MTHSHFRNTGAFENHSKVTPDGTPYRGDSFTPVFSWNKTPYECVEIVKILLGKYDREYLCVSPPVNVANNVSFLANRESFVHWKDLKCDDMGLWKHNGSPKRYFYAETKGSEVENFHSVNKSEYCACKNVFELKRVYHINKSDDSARRTISTITGL